MAFNHDIEKMSSNWKQVGIAAQNSILKTSIHFLKFLPETTQTINAHTWLFPTSVCASDVLRDAIAIGETMYMLICRICDPIYHGLRMHVYMYFMQECHRINRVESLRASDE